jgi:hypothetical protein
LTSLAGLFERGYISGARRKISIFDREEWVEHAGADALDRLGALLASLRERTLLRERRAGIFYVKGRAFLHFHADRAGLFADLRAGDAWRRLPANGPEDYKILLDLVDQTLERAGGGVRRLHGRTGWRAGRSRPDREAEIERLFDHGR